MAYSIVKIRSMFQETKNVKMICPDCLGQYLECDACDGNGIVAISDNYFYLEALILSASDTRDSVRN